MGKNKGAEAPGAQFARKASSSAAAARLASQGFGGSFTSFAAASEAFSQASTSASAYESSLSRAGSSGASHYSPTATKRPVAASASVNNQELVSFNPQLFQILARCCKRDAITRGKALQEAIADIKTFLAKCSDEAENAGSENQSIDSEAKAAMLVPSVVEVLLVMSKDVERKHRLQAAKMIRLAFPKAKKGLGPHLKRVSADWLMLQSDGNKDVAQEAVSCWEECFSDSKKRQAAADLVATAAMQRLVELMRLSKSNLVERGLCSEDNAEVCQDLVWTTCLAALHRLLDSTSNEVGVKVLTEAGKGLTSAELLNKSCEFGMAAKCSALALSSTLLTNFASEVVAQGGLMPCAKFVSKCQNDMTIPAAISVKAALTSAKALGFVMNSSHSEAMASTANKAKNSIITQMLIGALRLVKSNQQHGVWLPVIVAGFKMGTTGIESHVGKIIRAFPKSSGQQCVKSAAECIAFALHQPLSEDLRSTLIEVLASCLDNVLSSGSDDWKAFLEQFYVHTIEVGDGSVGIADTAIEHAVTDLKISSPSLGSVSRFCDSIRHSTDVEKSCSFLQQFIAKVVYSITKQPPSQQFHPVCVVSIDVSKCMENVARYTFGMCKSDIEYATIGGFLLSLFGNAESVVNVCQLVTEKRLSQISSSKEQLLFIQQIPETFLRVMNLYSIAVDVVGEEIQSWMENGKIEEDVLISSWKIIGKEEDLATDLCDVICSAHLNSESLDCGIDNHIVSVSCVPTVFRAIVAADPAMQAECIVAILQTTISRTCNEQAPEICNAIRDALDALLCRQEVVSVVVSIMLADSLSSSLETLHILSDCGRQAIIFEILSQGTEYQIRPAAQPLLEQLSLCASLDPSASLFPQPQLSAHIVAQVAGPLLSLCAKSLGLVSLAPIVMQDGNISTDMDHEQQPFKIDVLRNALFAAHQGVEDSEQWQAEFFSSLFKTCADAKGICSIVGALHMLASSSGAKSVKKALPAWISAVCSLSDSHDTSSTKLAAIESCMLSMDEECLLAVARSRVVDSLMSAVRFMVDEQNCIGATGWLRCLSMLSFSSGPLNSQFVDLFIQAARKFLILGSDNGKFSFPLPSNSQLYDGELVLPADSAHVVEPCSRTSWPLHLGMCANRFLHDVDVDICESLIRDIVSTLSKGDPDERLDAILHLAAGVASANSAAVSSDASMLMGWTIFVGIRAMSKSCDARRRAQVVDATFDDVCILTCGDEMIPASAWQFRAADAMGVTSQSGMPPMCSFTDSTARAAAAFIVSVPPPALEQTVKKLARWSDAATLLPNLSDERPAVVCASWRLLRQLSLSAHDSWRNCTWLQSVDDDNLGSVVPAELATQLLKHMSQMRMSQGTGVGLSMAYIIKYMALWDLLLSVWLLVPEEHQDRISFWLDGNQAVEGFMKVCFSEQGTMHVSNSPQSFVLDDRLKAISECDPTSAANALAWLFGRTLQCFPATARSWVRSQTRGIAKNIEDFVNSNFSQQSLQAELDHLVRHDFGSDMDVKVRRQHNEVQAIYRVDEAKFELLIKLPPSFPLNPPEVSGDSAPGVPEKQWRAWKLSLRNLLCQRNGALLDALKRFRKNIDNRFDGVEPCPICYSVIGPVNQAVPNTKCKTCKQKFHSGCLHKWFQSSQKTNCPYCRSVW